MKKIIMGLSLLALSLVAAAATQTYYYPAPTGTTVMDENGNQMIVYPAAQAPVQAATQVQAPIQVQTPTQIQPATIVKYPVVVTMPHEKSLVCFQKKLHLQHRVKHHGHIYWVKSAKTKTRLYCYEKEQLPSTYMLYKAPAQ